MEPDTFSGNEPPVYAGPSGLSSLFALTRPHGLGYEILAFQAIAKWVTEKCK